MGKEQISGRSVNAVDKARESLARFALNNPGVFNAIAKTLTGDGDDPLMPERLTSPRQKYEIHLQFKEKLAGDENSEEAQRQYHLEHPREYLSMKLLVDSINEVVGKKMANS